jgi:hypothetical protein
MPQEIDRPDPLKAPIDVALARYQEQLEAMIGQIRPRAEDDPLLQWAHSRGLSVTPFRGKRGTS